MKPSERLRCWFSVVLLASVGVKCISAAPNLSSKVSSGEQVLIITTDASEPQNDSPSSGESWETDTSSIRVNKDDKLPLPDEPVAVPSKPVKPEIYSFRIQSDIKYRYSRTYVTSRVANKDLKKSQETTFRVVLPEAAFISKFAMEIDGKTYEAYVKEKEEAKRVYTQAQNQGQSAGLVEVSTRNSNIFNVNVNIKPQSKITFNLTYEELLSRRLGRYEQSINISPEQISSVKDFQILVNIEESQNITLLRVPNLRNDVEAIEDAEGNNKDAIIVRPSGNKANISWSPSIKDQEILSKQGITGKFVIQYDINRESNSGEVLLMEGYFVHFFAPEDLKPLRKHVVFILDISGSMWGRKMDQLKDSQKKILEDLSTEDFFNIITFSSDVFLWSPNDPLPEDPNKARWHIHLPRFEESAGVVLNDDLKKQPFPATKENIEKAKRYIDSLVANGGTNIHDSIITAINLTKKIKDARDGITSSSEKMEYEALPTALPMEDATTLQPSFESVEQSLPSVTPTGPAGQTILPPNVESLIIFLTDGEPTVGVTDPSLIQKFIQNANANLTIPIFSLGFGEGADFPFLRKLSLQNYGFGRKIYEASDAALQLKGFYNEIASPLLSKVVFNYTSPEFNITDLTVTEFPTIFGGNEVVVAGRLTPVAKPVLETEASEFADEVEATTNIAVVEKVQSDDDGLTETPATDSTLVFDDAPTIDADNDLVIADKSFLDVSISGSGREGVIDFDSPKLFCGNIPWVIPGLRPFPPRPTPPPTQEDQFLERLWAYLTIKQLIDRDLKDGEGSNEIYETDEPHLNEKLSNISQNTTTVKKESPKEHAMRLALKYGFVTPFTSLVVVKPNSSDVTNTISSDARPDVADSYAAPQSMAHYAIMQHPSPHIKHSVSNRIAGPTFLSQSFPIQPLSIQSGPAPWYPSPMKMQLSGYHRPPTPSLSTTVPPTLHTTALTNSFTSNLENESDYFSGSSVESTTPEDSSTSSPLTIDNVQWFRKNNLVLRINETDYKIALNETNKGDEGKPCQINVKGISGECLHLKDCIQSDFTESLETFTDSYFCSIQSKSQTTEYFVGACCPKKTQVFQEP